MRRFIIERVIEGIGDATADELADASARSNEVLAALGNDIQWVRSYITSDRIYCVYLAIDESTIRRHARLAGFPSDRICEIREVIDPASAAGES